MAKVLIFKLRPVESPFYFEMDFNPKNLKYIEWSADLNSYQLSETLNNQVVLNSGNFKILGGMCEKILDGEELDPKELFTVEIGKEGQFLEKSLGMSDIKLAKKVCENYDKVVFQRSQMDVLSRDHDILNNTDRFNNVHAIVVLDINNQYTGHIYAWLSPDSKHLLAIGIRSRVDMIFLRAENRGMKNVADYLIEGLRLFALRLGVENIIIPRPLSHMQALLINRYHFKIVKVSVDVLKSPIKLYGPFDQELDIYMLENLQTPITADVMSLTIIA